MAKTYFGFSISSTMFSSGAILQKETISVEAAKAYIAKAMGEGTLEVCLNPSHAATIAAMREKFGIEVQIPVTAAKAYLERYDRILVLQVAGLPRLDATRHEYSKEEVAKATFTFDLWEVKGPCDFCRAQYCGNCRG